MRAALLGVMMLMTLSNPAQADDTMQYWWTVSGDVRLDDNDLLTGAVIIRSKPDTFEPGQRLLRATITHQLKSGMSVSAGYAHVTTLNNSGPNGVQHRMSQGIGVPIGSIGASAVDLRLQAEEVFIPGRREIGIRGRGRVRLLHKLDATGKVDLQLSDELIWSLNGTDWGQKSGWTANRAGVMLHVKLNKRIGIGPAYTWQLINRAANPNRNDHVLGLNADVHF
jgi:Protein of unknown function (DUF2490)